jgi:hypothetical protein
MTEFLTYFAQKWAEIIVPLAIFLTTLAAGYALRKFLFHQLSRWAKVMNEVQGGVPEFIKRLHERYQAEGIIIPYPIKAINYGQEKA